MTNQYEELTKEDIIAELNRYSQIQETLYEHIKLFKEGTREEREIAQMKLRDIYGSFKEELKGHYKALSTARVKRNRITESYFRAAVDDIYVHISGVGVNKISRNSIDEFYSAVYDIGSYARYWMPKTE